MRVLLAEDERNIRVLATNILKQTSHTVVEAVDGAEALHYLERDPQFDLLIIDIRMPHMDGIELVERVRQYLPGLPILVMSAYQTDAEAVLQKEAVLFLPKPFSHQAFVSTLATL